MNRRSTEDFEGSQSILYDAIMVVTCHYTFAQTHGMWNSKSEP